jgi:hypothetical protein
MAHRRNRNKTDETEEIRSRIRDILIHKWDPIGISGICPPDEYDSYISTIFLMLSDVRTNHQRITDHLSGIAAHSMGLSDRPALRERCCIAATELMALRQEIAPR